MDNFATAEEQIALEKLSEKFIEVNIAAHTKLAPIEHHVNSTCLKAFIKCTHECHNRYRGMEESSNCIKNCRVPLTIAQQIFAHEKAMFQEHMNISVMGCLLKYEEAKLRQRPGALNDFISCIEQTYQESINMIPDLANNLKAAYGIKDNDSF